MIHDYEKNDVWYWKKIKVDKLDVYKFWNEDKSECYSALSLLQMLDCVGRATKEARKKYIRDLTIIFLYLYYLFKIENKKVGGKQY